MKDGQHARRKRLGGHPTWEELEIMEERMTALVEVVREMRPHAYMAGMSRELREKVDAVLAAGEKP